MKIGCVLSLCLQVCNNCDCDWELPASNATWESESWFCHLPCAHPYYWYKVNLAIPGFIRDDLITYQLIILSYAGHTSRLCAGSTKLGDGTATPPPPIEWSPTRSNPMRLNFNYFQYFSLARTSFPIILFSLTHTHWPARSLLGDWSQVSATPTSNNCWWSCKRARWRI